MSWAATAPRAVERRQLLVGHDQVDLHLAEAGARPGGDIGAAGDEVAQHRFVGQPESDEGGFAGGELDGGAAAGSAVSGGAALLDPDGASSPTVRTAAVALATQIRLVDMEPPADIEGR